MIHHTNAVFSLYKEKFSQSWQSNWTERLFAEKPVNLGLYHHVGLYVNTKSLASWTDEAFEAPVKNVCLIFTDKKKQKDGLQVDFSQKQINKQNVELGVRCIGTTHQTN